MSLRNKNYQVKFNNIEETEANVTFEGLASTFGNIDLQDDEIQPGAFLKSLNAKMPKLLWQHDYRSPIGKFTEAREVAEGLFVKGQLTRGIPKADEAGLLLKADIIDSMSIGFNLIDFEKREGSYLLKELDLFEISLVTFPANPEAIIQSVKASSPFADLPILQNAAGDPATDRAWDSTSAVRRVRVKTGSEESPSATYRNAFLYFDDDGSNYGDYKLPIADVVNDRLVVIPRAIFAAAAAVSGARGGVDLPSGSRASVIANINRYYAKMNLDSPFNKSGALIVDINRAKLIKDKREFEEMLSESVHFTKSARVYLASLTSFVSESQQEKQEKYMNQRSNEALELKKMLDSFINK